MAGAVGFSLPDFWVDLLMILFFFVTLGSYCATSSCRPSRCRCSGFRWGGAPSTRRHAQNHDTGLYQVRLRKGVVLPADRPAASAAQHPHPHRHAIESTGHPGRLVLLSVFGRGLDKVILALIIVQ